MKNVKAVIEERLTMDDVLKVTILLADIEDFAVVNQVYESFSTATIRQGRALRLKIFLKE